MFRELHMVCTGMMTEFSRVRKMRVVRLPSRRARCEPILMFRWSIIKAMGEPRGRNSRRMQAREGTIWLSIFPFPASRA